MQDTVGKLFTTNIQRAISACPILFALLLAGCSSNPNPAPSCPPVVTCPPVTQCPPVLSTTECCSVPIFIPDSDQRWGVNWQEIKEETYVLITETHKNDLINEHINEDGTYMLGVKNAVPFLRKRGDNFYIAKIICPWIVSVEWTMETTEEVFMVLFEDLRERLVIHRVLRDIYDQELENSMDTLLWSEVVVPRKRLPDIKNVVRWSEYYSETSWRLETAIRALLRRTSVATKPDMSDRKDRYYLAFMTHIKVVD